MRARLAILLITVVSAAGASIDARPPVGSLIGAAWGRPMPTHPPCPADAARAMPAHAITARPVCRTVAPPGPAAARDTQTLQAAPAVIRDGIAPVPLSSDVGLGVILVAQVTTAPPPAKAAEPESAWGKPKVVARDHGDGCGSPPVQPVISVHGSRATIRTANGPLCTVEVKNAAPPDTGSLTLKVPLEKPLLLGNGPVVVVLSYHAEKRKGWARGRLNAKVNGGGSIFDWLGTDMEPGEIRVPVETPAILMANELEIWLELQGTAQHKGSERLVLDAVTIQDE